MHGANARVEDMFASFDGDDFEAVMRAARSEIASDPASSGTAQQQLQAVSGNSSSNSLYVSVCALRAAAMAADATKKQAPALKKRRAPLDDNKSQDAWMLHVPYAVADTPNSTTAATVAAAAGQGSSTQLQSQHSSMAVSGEVPGSSKLNTAQLQLATYVGMSVDSSSDHSCDSSSDGYEQMHSKGSAHSDSRLHAAATAAGAAAGTRPNIKAAAAAAAGAGRAASASNNIVSSRALGSKLSLGQHVVAVSAARTSSARSTAAAGTAVLELGPAAAATSYAQLSPRAQAVAPTAVMPAADVVMQPAAHQLQQAATGTVTGTAAAPAGQGRQWSSSNTRSLRRALARLHSPLAPQ